ncbi:hypothetical protein V7S43_012526 [Phytophthora oleae]|uniref:Uncharacterized protein n=1 Tax=Phytophthora oleae TaxID=2107226 RepID=A0ABD3F7H2_9STRA
MESGQDVSLSNLPAQAVGEQVRHDDDVVMSTLESSVGDDPGQDDTGEIRMLAVREAHTSSVAVVTGLPTTQSAAPLVITNTPETTAAALFRKRGRPKGSRNKAKPTSSATPTEEPTRQRGRPPGSKNKPKRNLDTALDEQVPSSSGLVTSAAARPSSHPSEGSLADSSAGQYLAPQLPPVVAAVDIPAEVAARNTCLLSASTSNEGNTLDTQGQMSTPPPAATRPGRTVPGQSSSLSALYVNTLVAFSPTKEGWASSRKYIGVGSAYMVGMVCRLVKGLYQVSWLDSQFQFHVENMSLAMIQRGNTNYSSLHARENGPGWSRLCAVDSGESVKIDGAIDSLEICMEHYESPPLVPNSAAQVEVIKNFRFEPSQAMEPSGDLYEHADGTTTTRLRSEFRHIFEHSATASFLPTFPLDFGNKLWEKRTATLA